MDRTVFDVAADCIEVSGESSLSAVRLQKLVYYTFGWYGRLTGQPLFGERFYAMPHGPVVGALLTAHAGCPAVSKEKVDAVRAEWGAPAPDEDPYYRDVLASVWEAYRHFTPWQLEEMSHQEAPWKDAWGHRLAGARRADISADSIVSYFAARSDFPVALSGRLPSPTRIFLEQSEFEALDELPTDAYGPTVEMFKKLARV